MTTQRSILLDELRQVDSHPSADELYAMVRRRLPRISLGTVYRNLEILAGLGAIRRIDSGGGLKRFDGNPAEHYHIRCVACDRLVDAPVAVDRSLNDQVRRVTDFEIIGHQLEFLGRCPGCRTAMMEPAGLPGDFPPPGIPAP
jgi:Fur family ferric uptake transcriptional regulator